MRQLFLLALALLNSLSCSSPSHQLAAPAAGDGLLFGSLSSYSTKLQLTVVYQGEAANLPSGTLVTPPINSKQPRTADSEGGTTGAVFALGLPAGNYQIIDWRAVYEGSVTLGPLPGSLEPLRFTVTPNQAVYLGNLHLSSTQSHHDGLPDTRLLQLVLRQRLQRDALRVRQRHPEFSDLVTKKPPAAYATDGLP